MRRYISLLTIFVLAMAFVSANALAADFDITGETTKDIEFGKSVTFELNVKSNIRGVTGVVALVDGDNLGWVGVNKYFFFLPHLSSKDVNVIIFPQDNGSHRYSFTIQSFENHEIRESINLLVNAVGPKKSASENGDERVSIDSVNAKNTGSSVVVEVGLSKINYDKSITVDIYLRDVNGNAMSTYTEVVDGTGAVSVDKSFQTDNFLAGTYYVDAIVREFAINKKASVIIPEVHDMVEKREVTSGFLYETVSIVAENRGNVIENDYAIKESTPVSEYVTWDVEPTIKDVSGNYIESTWNFKNLRPNDKIIVSYTVHYWFTILKIIIALIIILAVIAIVYMKLSSPKITKRFIKKSSNEYLVIIEVKGSYFNSIRSVLVKDKLSPLMRLEEGKFDGIKPVIRKERNGTELLWRIGRMKKMDERILSYNIKGVVEAQIKMPSAMMRYKKTEEGEKLRVHSNIINLE